MVWIYLLGTVNLPCKRREDGLLSTLTTPSSAHVERVQRWVIRDCGHREGESNLDHQQDRVHRLESYDFLEDGPAKAGNGSCKETYLGGIGQVDIILVDRGAVRLESRLHKHRKHH